MKMLQGRLADSMTVQCQQQQMQRGYEIGMQFGHQFAWRFQSSRIWMIVFAICSLFLRQAESYAVAGLCEKCVNMVSHEWIFSLLAFVQDKMLESLQSSCDNSECKGGVLNTLHPTHLV
ncbi:unnamed protein product [Effrenium voratum]|uniref:Uncharacterized protein n=1 Tax=Effrenium voratum TaxID=2562239 RepID=A0AA36HS68_9DINO|nr:unnamed protein product [Effrenium voratum]CAJ1459189.1 unnamed protein product [Effrenium voratum]